VANPEHAVERFRPKDNLPSRTDVRKPLLHGAATGRETHRLAKLTAAHLARVSGRSGSKHLDNAPLITAASGNVPGGIALMAERINPPAGAPEARSGKLHQLVPGLARGTRGAGRIRSVRCDHTLGHGIAVPLPATHAGHAQVGRCGPQLGMKAALFRA